MQELTFEQVEEVSGGALPVAVALVLASPYAAAAASAAGAAVKAAAVVVVGAAGFEVGKIIIGD